MNRDPGRGRGRGRDLGRGRGRDRGQGRGQWRSPGGGEHWVPNGRSSDPSSHSNYSVTSSSLFFYFIPAVFLLLIDGCWNLQVL